jgi:hypothetical protein
MADRPNIPVLVGAVPLLAVTSFVVNEGYKTAAIAGSTLTQMVAPTTKTISIEAPLIGEFRALRPALEAMALTSRLLASVTAPLMKLAGIPVVAKTSVNLDMQITSLVFTQDNQMRDTIKVSISLTHVPRTQLGGLLGGALDLAVGAGSAFI